MEVIKLLAVCVMAAMVCLYLKNIAPPFAVFITLFVSVSVVYICIMNFMPYVDFFVEMTTQSTFYPYAKVLFKVCAIGILTRLASEICKDAGENSLSSKALLAGKTAIMICALPVIKTLFEQIKEMLN